MHDFSIWEANADGTNLHRLLPGWEGREQARGSWSRDGKYFFFESKQEKSGDIWVLPERTFLQVHSAEPIRLTHGPLDFGSQLANEDGRRMFLFGGASGIEFVSYDLHSHQFHPAYTNIRGSWLDFSRDGQWIAFSDYGRGTLGTMKSDGSQRLDLTAPNHSGYSPRWSPGREIACLPERYQRWLTEDISCSCPGRRSSGNVSGQFPAGRSGMVS